VVSREEARLTQGDSDDARDWRLDLPLLALSVGLGMFAVGLGIRTRTFFPLLWGGMFGGAGLMGVFHGFYALVLVPLALGMLAFGYTKGKTKSWARWARQGRKLQM
jgi:hypothetical protein